MSMYEGIRLISDKQTVIFDIGSAYTKYVVNFISCYLIFTLIKTFVIYEL